jgi:hypothetical protein
MLNLRTFLCNLTIEVILQSLKCLYKNIILEELIRKVFPMLLGSKAKVKDGPSLFSLFNSKIIKKKVNYTI